MTTEENIKQSVAEFRPSIGGRIRHFLFLLLIGSLISFIVAMGLAWLFEDVFNIDNRILAIAISYVLMLAVIIRIAMRRPPIFTSDGSSVTVRKGSKSTTYSLNDYAVSAETLTTYYNGVPITNRYMNLTALTTSADTKDIKIKLVAYNKKKFSELLTAINRMSDKLEAEKRAAYDAAHPQEAVDGPIVRGQGQPSDSRLDKSATYAIVTEEALFEQKTNIVVFIIMLVIGLITLAFAFFDGDIAIPIVGLFLVAFGIFNIATSTRKNVKSNTMLGSEITPETLSIRVKDDVQIFTWDNISKIELTPVGYEGQYNRMINLHTQNGVFRYIYGTETNDKLDENYSWFVEYVKLHALDKVEYLFR